MLEHTAPEAIVNPDIVDLLATTFHELREGTSLEGSKIETPSAVMSTAEAVSLYYQTALTSFYYETDLSVDVLAQNIRAAVLKESKDDLPRLKSYWNTVVKARGDKFDLWRKFYEARKWIK
jgi:hypothetical protein